MNLPGLADLDAEIDRRRTVRMGDACRTSLLAFVQATYPGLDLSWHHVDLCAALERFAADVDARKSPRLALFMPPRHTKSTIATQRFPVWYMGARPGVDVFCASYGQDLADEHSRAARDVSRTPAMFAAFPHSRHKTEGPRLDKAREAAGVNRVRVWTIGAMPGDPRRSHYRAVGVCGPMTGKGAHVLLIDDPVKDAEEAGSATRRQAVWDWYTSTAYTRLAPGGGVILIATRWHADDLPGRVLAAAKDGGDQWQVLAWPAIAEADEYGPDGALRRREGEALHPARYGPAALAAIRETLGPHKWAALYQQRPVPAEGSRVKVAWLAYRFDAPPARADTRRLVHSWDTASKAGQLNDYSVCTVLADLGHRVHVLDVYRRRMEFPALVSAVESLAERDNPNAVLVEDKGIGTALIQHLRASRTWRWSIVPIVPVADKVTRLEAETAAFEAGRVWLPARAPWLAEWEAELLAFPHAPHDDQVDSLSQALAWLRGRSGSVLQAWAATRR